MSAEFSRRSFLKYTAITAAAVAGSSLLGGCAPETSPVQQAVGTTNTVLQVRCKLESAVYDDAQKTATFTLSVYNGRGYSIWISGSPLSITRDNFKVTGPNGYYAYMNEDLLEVSSTDSFDPQIKPSGSATFCVVAKNISLASGETLRFTFYPDIPEYTEYNANWVLTREAMTPAQSSGS